MKLQKTKKAELSSEKSNARPNLAFLVAFVHLGATPTDPLKKTTTPHGDSLHRDSERGWFHSSATASLWNHEEITNSLHALLLLSPLLSPVKCNDCLSGGGWAPGPSKCQRLSTSPKCHQVPAASACTSLTTGALPPKSRSNDSPAD